MPQVLSKPYLEIKRLRSNGKTSAALAQLRNAPPASDEDAFEAAICLFVCGDIASAVNVCQSYKWKAAWSQQGALALTHLLRDGQPVIALACARKAVADSNAGADVKAVFLMLLQANGLHDEADRYIARHWQEPPPGETLLLTVMAEVAVAMCDWRQAYRYASAVVAADPEDFRALIVLSVVNQKLNNPHEALGQALRARLINPQSQQAILQIARCYNALGDYYAALGFLDTLDNQNALAPQLHVERGLAYVGLDFKDEALAALTTALQAEPPPVEAMRALIELHSDMRNLPALDALVQTHAEAIGNDLECQGVLGLARLAAGEITQARACLERAFTLAREQALPLNELPWPVPEPLLRHDCEQLEMLAQRGKLEAAGQEALGVLRRYLPAASDIRQSFAPTGAEAARLQRAMTDIHYRPDARFDGPVLAQNDYREIEDRYLAGKPPIVVIENLLTPEALAALREYCEEATIWRHHNPRGYVGALLSRGFNCEVLLKLSHELKQAMPRVIGDYPLLQSWGFKYDQRMQGIHMHADFAKVNLNFWITPDEACADPTTGGLVVYDVPAPLSWTFADYNTNQSKMMAYLKANNAKRVRVPYRQNRCLLFESNLIHVTDEIHFKPGYENRRVNVTLLYGRARARG